MRDVQSERDSRRIPIDRVGVGGVSYPIVVMDQKENIQHTVASVSMSVSLPHEYRGTHMSRFIEVLSDWSQKPVSNREMEAMLRDIMGRLGAQRAHIEIRFKYFIEKKAPVSGLASLLDYDCLFDGKLTQDGQLEFVLGIEAPFTSLCPCSREISEYGAHNQRGAMRVRIRYVPGRFIWIEDLVDLMERQGSSPVYPLLKREDEKFVTESAYDNPKFIEDVLRDLVLALRSLDGAAWFEVECESFESIHNHSAYAYHAEEVGGAQ